MSTRKPSAPSHQFKSIGWLLLASVILMEGCDHSNRATRSESVKPDEGKTAGISVVHPEKRDIRMVVTQPGTLEAYETTPIYSRIAGYVDKYRYNIGDRVTGTC